MGFFDSNSNSTTVNETSVDNSITDNRVVIQNDLSGEVINSVVGNSLLAVNSVADKALDFGGEALRETLFLANRSGDRVESVSNRAIAELGFNAETNLRTVEGLASKVLDTQTPGGITVSTLRTAAISAVAIAAIGFFVLRGK